MSWAYRVIPGLNYNPRKWHAAPDTRQIRPGQHPKGETMGPWEKDGNGCKPGQPPVEPREWIENRYDETCYFYPMRDCPGWAPGGTCNRMDKPIPLEET